LKKRTKKLFIRLFPHGRLEYGRAGMKLCWWNWAPISSKLPAESKEQRAA
jgi:hypothetical protein